MEEAFAGIDVAFAKKKRLPVSICARRGGKLVPLPLRTEGRVEPPRGRGNRFAMCGEAVKEFARETDIYLRQMEEHFQVRITRVAIDAPSAFRRESLSLRSAERAMADRGISYFKTPSRSEFDAIIEDVKRHLASGGAESRMPNAQRLWMLVGFALFDVLREARECMEVFPQATAVALDCATVHKSKPAGLAAQLSAAQRVAGWTADENFDLSDAVFGPLNDKLDAFLSAWIASLPQNERIACGSPPDDAIWIPRGTTGVGSTGKSCEIE